MEYNGMYIDAGALSVFSIANKRKQVALIEELRGLLPVSLTGLKNPLEEYYEKNPYIVNFSSAKQLSILLFGGTLKYKQKKLIGVYKNGNDKYKYVDIEVENPLFKLIPKSDWETATKGIYKTSDEVLEEILHNLPSYYTPVKHFVQRLRELRTISKEQSGYYDSIPALITLDNCIHQTINTCATATGRLSQKEPNLQNTSGGSTSNVKRIFTSRWGVNGRIVEADYSQLEVIALAYLSQDKQLMEDIITGTDLHQIAHDKVVKYMDATLSSKEQRRQVKSVNFGLIYRGGAKTLAVQSGLPVEVAKKIIASFYNRYPDIKMWQHKVKKEVEANRKGSILHTARGYPAGISQYTSPTGRKYTFREYDAPMWLRRTTGQDVCFSTTQMCNYPVQGLATGDIVPMVIGILFKKLKVDERLRDKCLMINTVHDSIVFDIHIDILKEAVPIIKEVMEAAPEYLKSIFDIDFNLPLSIEVTAGYNWKDQKPL